MRAKAKPKTSRRHYVVTIRVASDTGARPDVRTLMGDTVFLRLDEGMRAAWTIKRDNKGA